jgi:WD40 repeat protein
MSEISNQIVTSSRDGQVKLYDIAHNSVRPVISIFTGAIHFCNTSTLKNSIEDNNLICSPYHEEHWVTVWDIRAPFTPVVAFDPKLRGIGKDTGILMSLLFRSTLSNSSQQVLCGYESGHLLAYDIRAEK